MRKNNTAIIFGGLFFSCSVIIADALEGKHPAVPVDVVHRALREIHERADAVRRQRFQAMAAEGVKYLEENAKKEGVNSTESGLQFRVINQVFAPLIINRIGGKNALLLAGTIMSVRIIGSSFATSALEVVILKTLHMFS